MVRKTRGKSTQRKSTQRKSYRQRGGTLTGRLLRRVMNKMAEELPLPENSNSEEEANVHSTYRTLASRLTEEQARAYLRDEITLENLVAMTANSSYRRNRTRGNTNRRQ